MTCGLLRHVRRPLRRGLALAVVLAALLPQAGARAEPPAGDEFAPVKGTFGPPLPWPIIAIHAVLLPDGRVLTYGSDAKGKQGAQLIYEVWDPAAGGDRSAHMVLPNTTGTDIFCSGQSVIAATGEVFITGGDLTISGIRNFSTDATTIYSPSANDIRPAGAMAYPRWYPSVVSMPNGSFLILGGRVSKDKLCTDEGLTCAVVPASTPELFSQDLGWQTLSGAKNETVFGTDWFYPRAYLAPNGKVILIRFNGEIYSLDTSGDGSLSLQPTKILVAGRPLPSAMYAPGKILTLRNKSQVFSIDVNGELPIKSRVSDLPGDYGWSNMTVLADGKVFVNGGRGQSPKLGLDYANYDARLWDPATGAWSEGARAQKPRLYHSTSLLLPDGSVLTAGGGAPGPVKNLNAEIYYPPYLYAQDGTGQPAERPTIVDAPAMAAVGETMTVALGEGTTAAKVTLLRTGSVTHSSDTDQRFLEAAFAQEGATLSVSVPGNVNVALPGYYMLFVFNDAGTPSVARLLRLTEPAGEEPPPAEPPPAQ